MLLVMYMQQYPNKLATLYSSFRLQKDKNREFCLNSFIKRKITKKNEHCLMILHKFMLIFSKTLFFSLFHLKLLFSGVQKKKLQEFLKQNQNIGFFFQKEQERKNCLKMEDLFKMTVEKEVAVFFARVLFLWFFGTRVHMIRYSELCLQLASCNICSKQQQLYIVFLYDVVMTSIYRGHDMDEL